MRQLTYDLSVAGKAADSSNQAQADADVALKALPIAQREVEALNARVSCPAFCWVCAFLLPSVGFNPIHRIPLHPMLILSTLHLLALEFACRYTGTCFASFMSIQACVWRFFCINEAANVASLECTALLLLCSCNRILAICRLQTWVLQINICN